MCLLRVYFVMSRRRVFNLVTLVCVLGLSTLLLYTTLVSLTTPLAYGTQWKQEHFKNRTFLKYVLNSSGLSLPTAEQINNSHSNISLTKSTVLELRLNKANLDLRGTEALFSSPDTEIKQKSQTNNNTDSSAEVLPTTTMTFNKTLEVHCKMSPFIECSPRSVQATSEKIYKISYLRMPKWHPKWALDVSLCPYQKCELTDAIITKDTDLVVIYGVNLMEDFQLPQRWRHQIYAITTWEPPIYTRSFFNRDADTWSNRFDLLMTYRLDADISSPYGRLKFNPKPLEKRPNYYEIAKNKTGTAVWIVSHCLVQSRRHNYIKEMQKYIDVDIFGKCGQQCPGSSCNDLLPNYKFYLSFENSMCTDYVTEKFFKIFLRGTYLIPVVRGGVDYDKHFPSFTFINAAHFKTPKDLALHLKDLASDLETYSKYLEYKDLYERTTSGIDVACKLCEYLHTHTKTAHKKIYSLKESIVDGQCHKPTDI